MTNAQKIEALNEAIADSLEFLDDTKDRLGMSRTRAEVNDLLRNARRQLTALEA